MSIESLDTNSNAPVGFTNVDIENTASIIFNNCTFNGPVDPKVLLVMLELNQQIKRATQSAYKVLPPWAEKMRIENRIRSDESIKEALGSDVASIEKDLESLESNVYIVTGENGEKISVKVLYGHTDLIGPAPFSLEILKQSTETSGLALKALPPWAEEKRIQDRIRSDEKVKEALGSDVVSIEKDEENGVYIVRGENNKAIAVSVSYGHFDLIGPPPIFLLIHNK